MISGRSLIGGEWQEGQGTVFSSYDPLKKKKIKDYKGVGTSQINNALDEAQKAYFNYRSIDLDERAHFIDAIANEIEDMGDELLEICNEETGLGIPRLTGERGRTCGQLSAFANLVREGHWQQARIDTAIPDREPVPKADIRRVLMPLGPVAVFSASNFPLAFSVLGGDTASALAAGNPVIVKAHPSHPGTSELCAIAMEKALKKNGLPKGIFSLLQGAHPSVSTDLVNHPKLKAVGFTGSTKVGRILFNLGASRSIPIPVFSEMGSTNPLFILPKAIKNNGSSIATGLANSITLGTGQFCTKPGLVFTIKSEHSEKFKKDLKHAMEEVQLGTMLNSGIKSSLSSKLEELGKEENITTFTGGSEEAPTLFLVSGSDFIQNPELEDEVFGPVALIIECDNMKEMVEATISLGGHLTGTIHTDNDPEAEILKTTLEEKVGRIVYNGFPTGVEVCPSMHHGGPYPSSTHGTATSVGTAAIERFCKVICYQDAPQDHLPEALTDKNPRAIMRLVNGKYSTNKL